MLLTAAEKAAGRKLQRKRIRAGKVAVSDWNGQKREVSPLAKALMGDVDEQRCAVYLQRRIH
jgi:hypothetical protein